MAKIVFGTAGTEFQAEAVVNELKVADFLDENISVVLADRAALSSRHVAHRAGGSRGTLGWLPRIGSVSIPGAGPFIAAGRMLGALNAAAVGSSSHGIADALTGMGLDENDAIRFEKGLRSGSLLIAVQADTDAQAEHARSIFEQAQIRDIVSTVESELAASPDENFDRG
ncbi:MAG TPA: hypothetical protein VHB20_00720 [Verrucomicrobiae bacterium]|jgi:hypothetical protein|nr:hypothetical protein [Verrucomicrobiae bacterium]